MSEYHFPIPESKIKSDIRRLIKLGIEFTNEDAVMDLMLMLDKGDKIPSQEKLAQRWNWRNRMTVQRALPALKKEALNWRAFGKKSEQSLNNFEQSLNNFEQKNGSYRPESNGYEQKVNSVCSESEQNLNRVDLIHTRVTDTNTNTNHIKKGTNVPVVLKDKIDWKSRYAEVMNSWNRFAQSNNLSSITKLSENRRKWIRSRYDSIMPHIETIYRNLSASDFHMGRTTEFAGVTFETLWRNKEHYLRYIEMKPKKRRPEAMEFVGSKYVGSSTELKQAYHNGQSGTAYRSSRDKR